MSLIINGGSFVVDRTGAHINGVSVRVPHISGNAGGSPTQQDQTPSQNAFFARCEGLEINGGEFLFVGGTHTDTRPTPSAPGLGQHGGWGYPTGFPSQPADPQHRFDTGRGPARREDQLHVVDDSDDEDDTWSDVHDGAASEADSSTHRGSERTHRTTDAFLARPPLYPTAMAYFDRRPTVPPRDIYGNIRGYQYPTRAAQAPAPASAWQGAAGGSSYAQYTRGPRPGFTGNIVSNAHSSAPGSGYNHTISWGNNNSDDFSVVSLSNTGNSYSSFKCGPGLSSQSKKKNSRKH